MSRVKTLQMQKVRDFRESFGRVLKLNPDMPFIEAYNVTARSAAPRFYCTLSEARRFCSLLNRKKPLPLRSENKKKMYQDLFEKWKASGSTTYMTLDEIIMQPAPSFYIDASTAQGFGHKYKL